MTLICGRFAKNLKRFNINKWNGRTYSQQKALKEIQNYSSTVLLPQTGFPARHKDAKRNEVDKQIFEKADFAGLYAWQREHLKGPDFVLHDGPPYANGEPHIGHAINKILKDIVLRNNIVRGRRVNYIPGWDCHGLPIELKVLNHGKKEFVFKSDMNTSILRDAARKYANEEALKQRKSFESWGVVADWDNQCYYTADKCYVKNQLRMFYEMYEKGYIYRDVKPVHWSPSSGTALAEAELEYDSSYASTQVYLDVPLINVPEQLKAFAPNAKYSAVIWTTTPWSLVGNQAICFSPELQYSALSCPALDDEKLFIVATPLVKDFVDVTSLNVEELFNFDGRVLASAKYNHPLKGDEPLPFLEGSHVSASKGTGLVHTAPAHGPDDFLVALKHKMPVKCYVNEEGRFADFDPDLDGLTVLGEGSKRIIEKIHDNLVFSSKYVHSYPLDWRTKKPIIIRASNQWFVKTEALKQRALEELKNVVILPYHSSGKNRSLLTNQVDNRPYWCISRQRVWGTPIPCLYDGDRPVINRELVESIIKQMDEQGVNSWWNNPVDEKLVPRSVLDEFNTSVDRLRKGKDIMDIWMDSGLSWSSVLDGQQADLYLEGLDQCTGWFQSSLMTSIAIKNRAPYKKLFIHGFAVDDCGRKMSKSIGNVVDPKLVVRGGKDLKKHPPYGVDTLRWWVAGHATQHSQIVTGDSLLMESHTDIAKLRLLMKFLLGTLNDLDSSTLSNTKQFNYIDSYMLHLLYDFHQKINEYYDNMEYNKVRAEVLNFTTNQISGLYCHIVKDRLYCEPKDSLQRRSCQVVINHVFVTLCQIMAPVLPHLIEEVWSFYPFNNDTAFFKSSHCLPEPIWNRPYLDLMMEVVMKLKRKTVYNTTGVNSFQYNAMIFARPDIFDMLSQLQPIETQQFGELSEILQVSEVTLKESEVYKDKFTLALEKTKRFACGRCRRYTSDVDGGPCERCKNVLDTLV